MTRKDKIRNKYIRGTVKVERLGMEMMEGRLRWYGHVMRDQEYIGRRVMEMELPGKRKRGRPKRRFLDVVKEDMGKVGAREMDIENRQDSLEKHFALWLPLIKRKAEKKRKLNTQHKNIKSTSEHSLKIVLFLTLKLKLMIMVLKQIN